MEIGVKKDYYGTEIIITDTNVEIVQSISETLYGLKDDGKKDFSKRLGDDITDEWMDTITRLMDDVMEYRDKEYNCKDLIIRLFENQTCGMQNEIFRELESTYEFDEIK